MKCLIALLILVSSASFAIANQSVKQSQQPTCEDKLVQQLDLGKAWVTQVRMTFDGPRYQVFTVNTTLDGGDAQLEAVVRKADCKVVDHSLVWAE